MYLSDYGPEMMGREVKRRAPTKECSPTLVNAAKRPSMVMPISPPGFGT